MERYAAELENCQRQNVYRSMEMLAMTSPCQGYIQGKKCIVLASNNYLGLTHAAAVKNAAIEAVQQYGTGGGGARLITGNYPVYEALERQLATFKRAESALVFPSGYMANVGTISTLAGPADVIFSDSLNHASIIDGCRLAKARTVVYKHAEMAHLAQCLAATPCQGRRLIVTDGVFSMDGDIAPLDKITKLAQQYQALVMVDDAHAVGILGEGRGTAAYFGVEASVQIQMGTLSKALAAQGGYIAGKEALIAYIRNKARSFIFTTALPPAATAAALAALQEVAGRPQLIGRVLENAKIMRRLLTAKGIGVKEGLTPIIPIVIGEAGKTLGISRKLLECGVFISAVRPPTVPEGASRLRLTVTAAHTREELVTAADTLQTVLREYGVIP